MTAAILLFIYVAGFYQEPALAQAPCNDGDIRLEGGELEAEGRVEVCMNGKWSTVCDDEWGSMEASVACRQLGYSDKKVATFGNASFGRGCDDLQIYSVKCNGSEEKLVNCTTEHKQCPHSNDAGVRCQPFLAQNVTAAVVSSTSVTISWKPPDSPQNVLSYYVICYATINTSGITYKNKLETKVQNSTLSVMMPKLLSSTTYTCCVSTNANILNNTACISIKTVKISNCSAVGGGLGALVVILVLLLIGAICIIVYIKFWQKIKAACHLNEQHSTSTGDPLKEDHTLHNPSYDAHNVEVPPLRYSNPLNITGIHNPLYDAQDLKTKIPPTNPNNSQCSTLEEDYEPVESDVTGTGAEGHEYSNWRR